VITALLIVLVALFLIAMGFLYIFSPLALFLRKLCRRVTAFFSSNLLRQLALFLRKLYRRVTAFFSSNLLRQITQSI
jgi:hypothetical protein